MLTSGLTWMFDLREKISAPMQRVRASFQTAQQSARAFQQRLDLMPSSVQKLEDELDELRRKRDATFSVRELNEFNRQIARAESRLNRMRGESNRSNSGSNGLLAGVSAQLGGLAAGGAALALMKDTAMASSDMGESMNKAKIIFGSSFDELLKFTEGSADKFGTSRQAALEAAASYGNLFEALGFGEKQVATFSKGFVQMSADFASFHNMGTEEARRRLMGALRGEGETLDEFGIVVNDYLLKQKAFKMGLTKSTKGDLTPAIKTQAMYALILEQSSKAQGDFARTSDGLANKTRTLDAKWKDFKANLGVAFEPIAKDLVDGMNKLMATATPMVTAFGKWFSENKHGMADWLSTWGLLIGKLYAVKVGFDLIGKAKDTFGDVISGIKDMRDNLMDAWKWSSFLRTGFLSAGRAALTMGMQGLTAIGGFITRLVTATAAQLGFNIALMANPIGLIVIGVAALGAAIWAIVANWETIKTWMSNFAAWIWEHHPFKFMLDLIDKVFPNFKTSLNGIWDWLKKGFADTWNWIYEKFVKPITGLISVFSAEASGAFFDTSGNDPKSVYDELNGTVNDPNAAKNANKKMGLGLGDREKGITGTGGSGIKHMTVNIGKLVEGFTVQIQDIGAKSETEIKEIFTRLLMQAVNDTQYQ